MPTVEALAHQAAVLTGGKEVSAWTKVIADLSKRSKEALCMLSGLEALQAALPSSCRLVRILRPVVQAFVLPVLDTRQHLPQRRAIAEQLVGHYNPRPGCD